MNDVRMAAVIRAVEARYPGTRGVVDPWTDPDGDPDLKWWVTILHVRLDDLGPLHKFATRIALDLYGPDPKPFVLSVEDRKTSRLFLERKAAEVRRERARLRRGRTPGRGARNRPGARLTRTRSA